MCSFICACMYYVNVCVCVYACECIVHVSGVEKFTGTPASWLIDLQSIYMESAHCEQHFFNSCVQFYYLANFKLTRIFSRVS